MFFSDRARTLQGAGGAQTGTEEDLCWDSGAHGQHRAEAKRGQSNTGDGILDSITKDNFSYVSAQAIGSKELHRERNS